MTALIDALNERFTDADEIKDVATHGCSGGVGGFIYSSELYDFFHKHEKDIEDWLEEYGTDYNQLVLDCQTLQQLREAAVWFVVETYCQARAEDM